MNGLVSSGYKHSDIGTIPDSWSVRPLSELVSLMTNGFVGTATSAYVESDDGVTYIQGFNVEPNGFNLSGIRKVSQSFHKSHTKSCLRAGDVLTIQTGAIGVSTVVPIYLSGSNCHALVISRFIKSLAHPVFYCQHFNSNIGMNAFKEIETGTTMKHLNVGDMLQLLVPVPPLAEQQEIAEALLDMDAIIDRLDQLIAKKRDIQQAAMQQLLTGQHRLPGFSGEWEVKQLGDLVSRVANGCVYKSAEKSGVPITRIETISDGTINWERVGYAKPTPEIEPYKLQHGDILYSHINSIDHIGKVARYSGGHLLYHGMNLILLRPTSNVDSEFLFLLLSSEKIRRIARTLAKQAVSQASINTTELRALELRIPDLSEQAAIATILSDMDTELATLEARRDKARQLKQGMMQELLTGRIRLA